MTIGQRIKKLREENRISQVDLANRIGVSKQTLYKYENDIVTNIPSDKIEKIASVFNVTESFIMGWHQDVIIADENNEKYVVEIQQLSKNLTEDQKKYLLTMIAYFMEENKKE